MRGKTCAAGPREGGGRQTGSQFLRTARGRVAIKDRERSNIAVVCIPCNGTVLSECTLNLLIIKLYSGTFSNERLFFLPFMLNSDQREGEPIFLVILLTESPTFCPPHADIADTFRKNQSG